MSTVNEQHERIVYKTPEALSAGIAEGYRTLRHLTKIVLADPGYVGPGSSEMAAQCIELLIPIMEKLTGRTREQLLEATIRRILTESGLVTE